MHLRTLLLAGMTGLFGWVARGATSGTPDPPLVAAVIAAPVRVVVARPPHEEPAAEVNFAPEAELAAEVSSDDDAAGQDLGELLAKAEQRAELPHNAVHGQVTDSQSGEALAGVTVAVTAPQVAGTQTAITDDTGHYQLGNLPAGNYQMTFYYLDLAVQLDNVTVSSLDSTLVSERLPSSERPPSNDDYTANIPVVRTFEGVLISSGSEQDNTYVVEDVDTTDLRFGE